MRALRLFEVFAMLLMKNTAFGKLANC